MWLTNIAFVTLVACVSWCGASVTVYTVEDLKYQMMHPPADRVIYVANGTYSGYSLKIDSAGAGVSVIGLGNVTLIFNGPAYNLLDMSGNGGSISLLQNLTLLSTAGAGYAAVCAIQGNLTMTNIIVRGFQFGVRCDTCNLTLSNSVISDTYGGNGVLLFSSLGSRLTNVTFQNNYNLPILGSILGALYAKQSVFTIIGCTFDRNTGGSYGSAINVFDSSVVMVSTNVTSNVAAYDAVIWSCAGSSWRITNSRFTNNTGRYVSVLHVDMYSTVVLDSVEMGNNTALVQGAPATFGVADFCQVNITSSWFHHNSFPGGGSVSGVVFVGTNSSLNLINSRFTQNSARSLWTNSYFVMTGSTFNANTALYGAVHSGAAGLITDSTFSNNRATDNSNDGAGAAVVLDNPTPWTLAIRRCIFLGNVALTTTPENGGGAMCVKQGNIQITDSLFQGNSAPSGGALGLTLTGALIPTLMNVTFIGNTASLNGGAVVLEDTLAGTFFVTSCHFYNNQAGLPTSANAAYGGAVYVIQGSGNLQFTGTDFVSNRASHGGALSLSKATGAIMNMCNFASNQAFGLNGDSSSGLGGAIAGADMGSVCLSIAQTSFVNNVAGEGGAFYGGTAHTVNLGLTNCIFDDNRAGSYGGGISTGGLLFISQTNVTNNTATYGGGVNVKTSGKISLDRAYISDNSATNYGGGLHVDVCGSLNITVPGSTVSYNSAQFGGGVYISYLVTGVGVITGMRIAHNHAASDGGGFYMAEASQLSPAFVIRDSSFFANTAQGNGGGLYLASDCQLLVFNTLTNNVATVGGGVYLSGVTLTVDNAVLTTNTATERSGGIHCAQCTTNIGTTANFTMNRAPIAPTFSCTAGSLFVSPSSVGSISVVSNATAGSLLVADCVECGCPVIPSTVILGPTPCWPYVGQASNDCAYTCPGGYANAQSPGMPLSIVPGPALDPTVPCSPLVCHEPPGVTDNLHTTGVANATTGTVASYYCDVGYTLDGVNTTTCVSPLWLTTPPTCTIRACDSFTPPEHGKCHVAGGPGGPQLTCNNLYFGGVVNVTCEAGYKPSVGYSTCSVNSPTNTMVFNPPSTDIQCLPQPCELVDAARLPHMLFDYPANWVVCTSVNARCDDGYEATGLLAQGAAFTCQAATQQVDPTIYTLECIPLPCPLLPNVTNGNITYHLLANYSIPVTGVTATCDCEPGYVRSGAVLRTCQNRLWTGQSCECTESPCPLGAYVTSNCSAGNTTLGITCLLSCQAGAYGEAQRVSVCEQTALNEPTAFNAFPPLCRQCDTNSYSLGDAFACTLCQNGVTKDPGSTTPADCICLANYYEQAPGTGVCVDCPAGGFCAGGTAKPIADKGYFESGGQFVACQPTDACVFNSTCEEAYSGYLCGACADGYYRLNGRCLVCPGDIWWRIVVAVIVALILAYGLVVVVRPSDVGERSYGFASGTIILSFIQIVATFENIHVPWPVKTRQLFTIFSTLNLNLELAGPECFARFTFWQKFQLQMAIPLIVLGLMALLWPIWTLLTWLNLRRPPLRVIRRRSFEILKVITGAYLFFLMVAYLLLAKVTLSIFACQRHPGGDATLFDAATEYCYQGQWFGNAAVGGIGICLYVVGIPALTQGVYYYLRAKLGVHVATRNMFANFLVKKYHEDRAYWEAVTMLRKLTVVVCAVLLADTPFLQVAACSAVFFISCVATIVYRPYRWSKHNLLEIVSLVGSLIVLFCGQMSASPLYGPVQQEAISILAIVTIVICLAIMVACFILEAFIFFRISELKKKLKPDDFLTAPATTTVARSLLLSRDASMVITVGADGLIRGHSPTDLTASLSSSVGHAVERAALHRGHVALISQSMGLEIFDVTSRQVILRGATPSSPLMALAASDRGLVTGDFDGEVAFWRFHTPLEGDTTAGPRKRVESEMTSLSAVELEAVFEDGDSAAPSTSHQSFQARGQEINDVIRCNAPHGSSVCAVALKGSFGYSAAEDGSVKKWDAETGRCLRAWQLPTSPRITCLEATGMWLFVGTDNGSIYALNHIEKAPVDGIQQRRAQTGAITRLHVYRGLLAASSAEGVIVLFREQGFTYLQTLMTHESSITDVLLTADLTSNTMTTSSAAPLPPPALPTAASNTSASLLPSNPVFASPHKLSAGVTALWCDARGHVSVQPVQAAWHVRDFDPLLWKDLNPCLMRRRAEAARAANTTTASSQPTDISYQELDLISRDLGILPPDASSDEWARLTQEEARSLSKALRAET